VIIKTIDHLQGGEKVASDKLISYLTYRARQNPRYGIDSTK